MLHWVTSYPKSGNTWVRLFLMAYIMPLDQELDLNRRPVGFWQDCEPEFWEHLLPPGVKMDDMPQHELLVMRPSACIHMIHEAQREKVLAVVKSHGCNMPIKDMGECLFPPFVSGPSIYLYRDPRDVFLSFADHMGQSLSTAYRNMTDPGYGIARPGTGTCPVFVSRWDKNVKSWMRDTIDFPVLRMSYESLRADPETGFRAIIEHLNQGKVPIDEDRFRHAMQCTTLGALQEQETRLDEEGNPYAARSQHQARFFRDGKISGWRERLPRTYLKRIEREFGDTMRELGYELETRS